MVRAERIAIGSIALGCLVLGLKAAAWWVTGSAALYSDALESIVNVVASALAFGALRVSALPADANHPYGHDKIELFSAVVEGGLIIVAAGSIFEHAWATWHAQQPLEMIGAGLVLNGLATVLNGAWSWLLMRTGRRLRSPALVADGQHLMTDVVTSAGVLLGLGLVIVTGSLKIDPLLAFAIGVYVLWAGMRMIWASVSGLMDAAPEPAVVQRIRELVAESATGALEAHDLRSRHSGRLTFLEFHLVVPGSMTVSEAHQICDRIEARLKADMDHLMITIHVEPEEKAKQHGVLVL